MKLKQKLALFLTTVLTFTSFGSLALAATPTTLTLTNTAGDSVQVKVVGDANSTIRLSFLPTGAQALTTVTFGTTDASGNFSTVISSGGYNIPAGSPVYATVNGLQSTTTIWPTYSSSLTLSQTNLQLAVSQSITVNASSAVTLTANSNSTAIAASVNASQITVTGLTTGSGTLTFCGAGVGCSTITVAVGGTGQTQLTFSQNNVLLTSGQTVNVSIYGGDSNGFKISSNNNSSSVTASISGTSNVITLYGTQTTGTATIIICSTTTNTNCATLYVTVTNTTTNLLSFSPSTVYLVPGQTQTVTVSGGTNNTYYIFSNANSSVALATIVGNTITLVGGTTAGSSNISICSTATNAICGNFTATLSTNTNTTAANTISFSQNVVTVGQGQTVTVTASGGTSSGYLIASNSNPSAVTASVNGTGSIISLYGVTDSGSATITVCATASTNTCANLFVTVGPTTYPIAFSQNNITLALGQALNLSVTGATNSYIISSNSNSNAVTANLSSGSSVMALLGRAAGSSSISVCSSADTTNCATLYVTVNGTQPTLAQPSVATTPTQTVTVTTPTTATAPATTVVSSFKFTRFLTIGSTGNDVRELQKRLVSEGFLKSTPTGRFGSLTAQALKLFQKKHGILAVGYVGPATRTVLNK